MVLFVASDVPCLGEEILNEFNLDNIYDFVVSPTANYNLVAE